VADEICGARSQRREETPLAGKRKPAVEADGGGASAEHSVAEGTHRKKLVAPKAKRAAGQWVAERFGLSERQVCRLVTLDRNTLQSQRWRSGAQGEDTRDRRDHAPLRLPQDLRAAVTGRLEGESPEGLSGSIERKRSSCAAGRRRNPHRFLHRASDAHSSGVLVCDGLCP
jgi:hypothetical protein